MSALDLLRQLTPREIAAGLAGCIAFMAVVVVIAAMMPN
jgi:hypothetical protein